MRADFIATLLLKERSFPRVNRANGWMILIGPSNIKQIVKINEILSIDKPLLIYSIVTTFMAYSSEPIRICIVRDSITDYPLAVIDANAERYPGEIRKSR